MLPKPSKKVLEILRRRFDIAKGDKRVPKKARFGYKVRKEPTGTRPHYRVYAFDRNTRKDLTDAVSSVGFSPRGTTTHRKAKGKTKPTTPNGPRFIVSDSIGSTGFGGPLPEIMPPTDRNDNA